MILEAGKDRWKCWNQRNRMMNNAVTPGYAFVAGRWRYFECCVCYFLWCILHWIQHPVNFWLPIFLPSPCAPNGSRYESAVLAVGVVLLTKNGSQWLNYIAKCKFMQIQKWDRNPLRKNLWEVLQLNQLLNSIKWQFIRKYLLEWNACYIRLSLYGVNVMWTKVVLLTDAEFVSVAVPNDVLQCAGGCVYDNEVPVQLASLPHLGQHVPSVTAPIRGHCDHQSAICCQSLEF